MKITTAAIVAVLALGLSAGAQAREDEEAGQNAAKSEAARSDEAEVRREERDRVRSDRPGGFSIDKEYWGHGGSAEGNVDREMTDD
jgi:hypothetical protein